jgi:hypothetical protein
VRKKQPQAIRKKEMLTFGGHFQRDEHFVFQKAHNSFLLRKCMCKYTRKNQEHVFTLRDQKVFHQQHFESMCWRVGGCFFVDECQQNKDLDKDCIAPCLLHGEVKETMYLLTFQRSLG